MDDISIPNPVFFLNRAKGDLSFFLFTPTCISSWCRPLGQSAVCCGAPCAPRRPPSVRRPAHTVLSRPTASATWLRRRLASLSRASRAKPAAYSAGQTMTGRIRRPIIPCHAAGHQSSPRGEPPRYSAVSTGATPEAPRHDSVDTADTVDTIHTADTVDAVISHSRDSRAVRGFARALKCIWLYLWASIAT